MAKLQTIRCHYCRKLLFSARWSKTKRDQYGKEPKHRCPGLDEAMQDVQLQRMKGSLELAQRMINQALEVVATMAKAAESKPTKRRAK